MTYTIGLGPFHPVLRGPQRLVLRVAADRVHDVDYSDGFNTRGSTERLARQGLDQALHLSARICGNCSIAHTLAFCQALENLAGTPVPPRAIVLRSAAAELERAASHLAAVMDLLRHMGLERWGQRLFLLRESTLAIQELLTGARQAIDFVLPGGVRRSPDDRQRGLLIEQLSQLQRELFRTIESLIEQRALVVRTLDVGRLARSAAEQYGLRGPLARASGLAHDLRIDDSYAAYGQVQPNLVTQKNGDVYARMVVLLLESFESVKLTERLLATLPAGEWQGAIPQAVPQGEASARVEGPRGVLRYQLEGDGRRLTAVRIDSPRQIDRLIIRTLLHGARLDDVPLILASVDQCLTCAEP